MQKRLYDIGWSREKMWRVSQRRRARRGTEIVSLSFVKGSQKPDPRRTAERNHVAPSE